MALLGQTRAGWVLAPALLSMILVIAILAGAVDAAMSDYDEPVAGRPGADAAADDERDPIVPLPRRDPATRGAGEDRRAA